MSSLNNTDITLIERKSAQRCRSELMSRSPSKFTIGYCGEAWRHLCIAVLIQPFLAQNLYATNLADGALTPRDLAILMTATVNVYSENCSDYVDVDERLIARAVGDLTLGTGMDEEQLKKEAAGETFAQRLAFKASDDETKRLLCQRIQDAFVKLFGE